MLFRMNTDPFSILPVSSRADCITTCDPDFIFCIPNRPNLTNIAVAQFLPDLNNSYPAKQ